MKSINENDFFHDNTSTLYTSNTNTTQQIQTQQTLPQIEVHVQSQYKTPINLLQIVFHVKVQQINKIRHVQPEIHFQTTTPPTRQPHFATKQ